MIRIEIDPTKAIAVADKKREGSGSATQPQQGSGGVAQAAPSGPPKQSAPHPLIGLFRQIEAERKLLRSKWEELWTLLK